jgi:Arc/MetJ family transcription regulator
MRKRATIEIDEDLLMRAKRALGCTTARATVEEALRRATAETEHSQNERTAQQRRYLKRLRRHVDVDVLASEEMWPAGRAARQLSDRGGAT